MRTALAASLIGHAIVIAAGVVALPSTPPALPESVGEALPVELVAFADITDLPLGIDLGVVRPAPVEAPPPLPAAVEAPAAVPAPPPVATPAPEAGPRVVTPRAAPVAAAAAAVPPAVVREPGPAPAPTPTPPEPAPGQAPAAIMAALPRAKPNRQTAATPTPEPTPPPPEPTPPVVEPPVVEPPVAAAAPPIAAPVPLDPIGALAAAPPTATPSPLDREARLGVEGGAANAAMTQTEIDALMQSVYGCYSPPGGYTDPTEVLVVLQFRLNRDGTILGAPQVLQAPTGRYAQAAPESAIRAVLRCAPYQLPPEKYEAWQEVRMRFFPIDMVPR